MSNVEPTIEVIEQSTTLEVLNDGTLELLEVGQPTIEIGAVWPSSPIFASVNPPPAPTIGTIWVDMSS